MRNLMRINNYYNRLEAWRDWQRLAAQSDGYLVTLFQPPADASWRAIDKATAALREAAQTQAANYA